MYLSISDSSIDILKQLFYVSTFIKDILNIIKTNSVNIFKCVLYFILV